MLPPHTHRRILLLKENLETGGVHTVSDALAHAAAQALGNVLEQQVTHLVAPGVVQGLEVVQVYKQHGRRHSRAAAAGQHLLQAVYQQAAVGQLGQGIVKSQVAGFFLGGLAARNVDVDAEHLWACPGTRM